MHKPPGLSPTRSRPQTRPRRHDRADPQPDRSQTVAAANVQGVDLRINVQQSPEGVERRIDGLMQPIVPIGIIISVLMIAFTSGAIALIVRRYDDHLAQTQQQPGRHG